MSDYRGHITWAALLDAGLTHVDILGRGFHDESEWVVRSASGEALVRIRLSPVETWVVECFVPVSHFPGAPSSAREWLLEDTRTYLGGDVAAMLEDVSAITG